MSNNIFEMNMKTEYRVMRIFGTLMSQAWYADFRTKEEALAKIQEFIESDLNNRTIPDHYTIVEIYK